MKGNMKEIEKDVKPLDLILLELPSYVQAHCGSASGMDYAVGFFEKFEEGRIFLNQNQKSAYDLRDAVAYPLKDIGSYEVLRRFKPNPEDQIDMQLVAILDMQSE